MTEEQFQVLMDAIQEIRETVEMIAFDGLPDRCPHTNTDDHSLMGMPPHSRIWCMDCETYIHGGDR